MAIYAPVAAEGRKTTVKTLIQKERGSAATIQPLYIYTAREKEGMRGREGGGLSLCNTYTEAYHRIGLFCNYLFCGMGRPWDPVV